MIVLLGVSASTALAADSAVRKSFADGKWNGTARLHQVIQSATIDGTSTFTMKVLRGGVTGTLTLKGTGGGLVQGAQVKAAMSGRYALTGRATAPIARGALKFDVTSGGKRQTGAGQIKLTLSSLRGTCDRMTGKLLLAAATASASDQTLPLAFTATRVRGSGPRC